MFKIWKHRRLKSLRMDFSFLKEKLFLNLQEHALDNAYFKPLLMKVLHFYFDSDILSQDIILNWHKTPSAYKGAAELRKMVI